MNRETIFRDIETNSATLLINRKLLIEPKLVCITKQKLTFNLSIESHELKFRNYTSLFCKTHLSDEIELKTCYDTKSEFSLIAMKTIRKHYVILKMFKMKNDQRIRCQKIEKQKK